METLHYTLGYYQPELVMMSKEVTLTKIHTKHTCTLNIIRALFRRLSETVTSIEDAWLWKKTPSAWSW